MRKLINEEKVIELRSRLRVLESRKRASTEAEQGVANTLSELRFSDAELEALALESFKEEYKGDGFRAHWASLVSSPPATDPALVRSLEAIERRIAAEFPKLAPPLWFKEIGPRRDHFLDVQSASRRAMRRSISCCSRSSLPIRPCSSMVSPRRLSCPHSRPFACRARSCRHGPDATYVRHLAVDLQA